jgi:hypothetical protein
VEAGNRQCRLAGPKKDVSQYGSISVKSKIFKTRKSVPANAFRTLGKSRDQSVCKLLKRQWPKTASNRLFMELLGLLEHGL